MDQHDPEPHPKPDPASELVVVVMSGNPTLEASSGFGRLIEVAGGDLAGFGCCKYTLYLKIS